MIHDPNNQKTDKHGRSWLKYFRTYILLKDKPIVYFGNNCKWVRERGVYKKVIEKKYTFKDEDND